MFVVGVLLALIGGYYVGKASVPAPAPPAAGQGHAHAGPGYSLALEDTAFPLATQRDLRFRIVGGSISDFAVKHDKRMHVVVVRTDLTGYQHLHPSQGADGVWSVPLTLGAPGSWRVFADFAAVDGDGQQADAVASSFLSVAGPYDPVPVAPSVSDVSIDGSPRPGGTEPLTFRVPSGPLERYLGAYGHLVLVRAGDLAFVHVHPEDAVHGNGREVRFWVTPPGPGTYRAFFDYSISGTVRTAEFTLSV